jgi:hypothetical protein
MRSKTGLFVLILLFAGALESYAQVGKDIKAQLVAAMKKSRELTENASYRTITKVEKGEASAPINWGPYSSWRIEVIFPDRWRLTYTSGRKGDFIQIGKTKYSLGDNQSWIQSEVEKGPPVINSAPEIGIHGPNFEFYDASSEAGENSVTVFRVVKNPDAERGDVEKKPVTWTYWFNEKGIIFKHDGISYNGFNWVRTTSTYEYDPTIKIEPPATN